MNCEIVELENFSGRQATIYSVIMDDDDITLFEHFIKENSIDYRKEIRFIANRLLVGRNKSQHFKLRWFKIRTLRNPETEITSAEYERTKF